ncbi:MAG: hypothetical protein PHS95_03510 [Candidatus Pacebacteria bacterium]|nr:hypothetical protein [Candidatus Paceibacterota bacterium]
MVEIKRIENITKKDGNTDWSVNFTNGEHLHVRTGWFPFNAANSHGMMVHLFRGCKNDLVALFGWAVGDNSIALKDCYRWSKRFGFKRGLVDWRKYWSGRTEEVVDMRNPGESIALKIDDNGGILPP